MVKYKFEHADMEFSKDGQLDELIALDRYAIASYDDYKVGDTVVAIVDKDMGNKKVGVVNKILDNEHYEIKDRFNEIHKVEKELLTKPLETSPVQLWDRWAKGAASVEKTPELQEHWENEFRWLFDGYRYSLGGRIQLMLGQEFVTGKKAELTAFNCFVARSPESIDDAKRQFIDVLDVAFKEASIMKRGGGVGLNISTINTVKGTGRKPTDFIFYLDKSHKDYNELQDRISLDKFKGVTIVSDKAEFERLTKNAEIINATDSMENGLFDELKQMTSYAYDGKQVGIDFNGLRHRDAIVKSVNGRSSGSVSWMELFVLVANISQLEELDNVEFAEIFSHIVHLIIQGGSRRGALMLINTTENKNIHKFMERKKTPGYLSGANISVGISDEFMDKVIAAKEKISKTVPLTDEQKKAYELWTVLYSSAHASAEPGIVWLERMNKESNSQYFVELIATNPCFTGDMKLLTEDGYKTFEELEKIGESIKLINKDGNVSVGKVWCSGEKDIVEVKTGNGNVITCTPDHVFMTNEGKEVEAKDLKGKRVMPYLKETADFDTEYEMYGFIQGDGCLGRLDSESHKGLEVNVGEGDIEIRHLLKKHFSVKGSAEGRHVYVDGLNDKLRELGFSSEHLPNRVFPTTFDSWTKQQKRSFIRGCYSANGSVINVGRVSYKTTSKVFADKLVAVLKTEFGIKAYITTNKAKTVTFSNGDYECKESYDINIANFEGMQTFYNEIGFIHRYKMFKLNDVLINAAPKVIAVKKLEGKQKVYDFNEPLTNWGVVNDVIVHNCGEQPLPPWGVCNLGHFVLPRYFDKATGKVNKEDLARAVRIAVRLQDNIIDYTPYFLDENEKQQLGERRIGIGSMGLGTLMIHAKLRYGSDEGNEFIDDLYKFIATEAYKTSIDIAEEKGHFPKFDADKMSQSGFMKRLLPELPQEYIQKFYKTGIRNVTLLTQAPCGSTGTYIDNIPKFRELFGGTTTGIEPYFSWEYWRAGRLGTTKQTVDFAKKYMDDNGLKDVKDLPDYFVTAMDLAPSDHVKVQAAVQKWTDSSISKTANCPSDYTLEQTEELYLLSYELGLKGMTIYRDGSRDSQVLATKEEDAKLDVHNDARKLKEMKEKQLIDNIVSTPMPTSKIKKRPKRLYGFTEKVGFSFGDKFGRAYVTINLQDGDVWEVFISTKEKEVSGFAKALGLMTTKLLRLGGADDNLQQAIDTLTYDQVMGTLPSVVANILKQLQKEKLELDVKTGKKEFELMACPNCGEKAYDKGNCICHACGVSKCN